MKKKIQNKMGRERGLICAKLRGALRDADLSGVDLTGSYLYTQAQVDSVKGDRRNSRFLSISDRRCSSNLNKKNSV